MTEKDATAQRDRAPDQLMALLDATMDAIVCIDELRTVVLFNAGAEAIFGYRRSEILGQPLSLLLPARFQSHHDDLIRRFAASPTVTRLMGGRQEIFGRRRSGEEFSAEATIAKIEQHGERRFLVVLRDISQRKAMETALRESEQRLQLAVHAGRIGLFEHHHPTDEVYWSPIMREIFGIDGSRPVSVHTLFDLVRGEQRDATMRGYRDMLDGKADGRFSTEVPIVDPNGEERWITLNCFTLFSNGGGPHGAARTVGAVRDTTERRHRERDLEEQIARHTQALLEEIKQREDAQSALIQSQRMDALGRLTGGIAHDSNNLLTVITGNLELIDDDLPASHTHRAYLREAQEAARLGARLNQRLLTFSRRRKLAPRVIDLNDDVLAMTELLRRTLGESITLTTVLRRDIWPTLVDPGEIENAVLNLAINARDAMPAGGEVLVETSNATVTAGKAAQTPGLEPGDYVKLAVTDNGSGMPAEVAARAFDPFFTTKGQGTGLGLSTIYGFVNQSGGYVTIDSTVGQGTTVAILLPRGLEPEAGVTRAADSLGYPSGTDETVFVIEDNAQVRRLTVELLRRLGYRTLEAGSGTEALAMIEGGAKADLIFSDVVMPGGVSGFDVAQIVREAFPGQRVLLTSGDTLGGPGSEQNIHGDLEILPKPFTIAELARRVRDVLDR